MNYSAKDYCKACGKRIKDIISELFGLEIDKIIINVKKPLFTLQDRVTVTYGTAHKQGYFIDARLLEISQIHCIASDNTTFTFEIFETDSYADGDSIYNFDQDDAAKKRFDDPIFPELIYRAETVKGLPQIFIEIDKTTAGSALFIFKVRGSLGTEEVSGEIA